MIHQPVLLNEVITALDPQTGQTYIDATINGGGHAKAILKRIGMKGKLIGIDWDCDLIAKLKTENKKREGNLVLACDNYVNIRTIAQKYTLDTINGILFDLGFSLYHIEKSGRGFSFLRDEPLDMRYSQKTNDTTAEKIINTWPYQAIENALCEYGNERFAARITRALITERKHRRIERTGDLVRIIWKSVPRWYVNGKIHPATKTFQALRIAVNNELENLKEALTESISVLSSGGKLAVISFHSREDAIVKHIFQEAARRGIIRIITKKPVVPTHAEVHENPKARSAKLRAAIKI